jgi:ParB-like chromosome segregation protein Spo0J
MNTMPISNVKWLDRTELSPNLYNPNKVAPPEMALLKQSILQDGWLFPIIVFDKSIHIEGLTDNADKSKYTIIDGFHRYTISGDKDVYKLSNGKVPVVILNPSNPLATTVRMNRAKGTHAVLKMGDIVKHQIDNGKPISDIMKEFGMEKEEVVRLSNRMGIHKSEIIIDTDWSNSWIPE